MNLVIILFWLSLGGLGLFYLAYYSIMICQAKKPSNIRKRTFFPKLSLVIATYNEQATILRRLENVLGLDYPREKLEVLVADSGSTDNTHQIVQNFIDRNLGKIEIRLITQSQRLGKACALNYIWEHCNGKIVLITDADATFDKKALTMIVKNFADPSVGASTGKLVTVNPNKSLTVQLERNYRSVFEILRLGESNMDSTPIFNGPIAAFRRELLEKLESDTVADDTELSIRIRQKNRRAIYDPEAIAYEYTPSTIRSRLKQKTRRGQGIIQSLIRHRSILFNPKYGKYGLLVFPCEFFMHIISPILLVWGILIALAMIFIIEPLTVIPSFAAFAILLLSAFALGSLFRSAILAKSNGPHPMALVVTFLLGQLCLFLALISLLLGKTSYKWDKALPLNS